MSDQRFEARALIAPAQTERLLAGRVAQL